MTKTFMPKDPLKSLDEHGFLSCVDIFPTKIGSEGL